MNGGMNYIFEDLETVKKYKGDEGIKFQRKKQYKNQKGVQSVWDRSS